MEDVAIKNAAPISTERFFFPVTIFIIIPTLSSSNLRLYELKPIQTILSL
jgi:hypothetical protein